MLNNKDIVKIPELGIEITLEVELTGETSGGILTKSGLHSKDETHEVRVAMDTLETFIVAAAVNGLNVGSLAFIEAVQTAVDAANDFEEQEVEVDVLEDDEDIEIEVLEDDSDVEALK